MSTSQMISGLCGLGLVGVLISKQILLLNEETIVLVAFIAFVYTVYTKAGSMVDEIFVSRRAAIQSELQQYVEMQEEVLTSLVREHTAHDLVSQSVQDIARTTLSEMGGMGAARRAHVEAQVSRDVHQRLRVLGADTSSVGRAFQSTLVDGFQAAVCEEFRRMSPRQRRGLVQSAIRGLRGG
jgi:uncharacterized membrane protein YeiB